MKAGDLCKATYSFYALSKGSELIAVYPRTLLLIIEVTNSWQATVVVQGMMVVIYDIRRTLRVV